MYSYFFTFNTTSKKYNKFCFTCNITSDYINLKLIMYSLKNIVSFILSWSPYGIFCVLKVFSNSNNLSPLLSTLAAMFAKTSLIWTPLSYILLNIQIKDAFVKTLKLKIKSGSFIKKKHINLLINSINSLLTVQYF